MFAVRTASAISGDEKLSALLKTAAQNLIRLKNIIFNGLYCRITPDQIFKNLFLISAVHPFTSLFCFENPQFPVYILPPGMRRPVP